MPDTEHYVREDVRGFLDMLEAMGTKGVEEVGAVEGRIGGAALIDREGRLVGVGSLMVNDAAGPDAPVQGNMFVPIDLLKPILKDLLGKV